MIENQLMETIKDMQIRNIESLHNGDQTFLGISCGRVREARCPDLGFPNVSSMSDVSKNICRATYPNRAAFLGDTLRCKECCRSELYDACRVWY